MINMKVLDYRITSDSNQVIVNKVRRNEEGDITILIDKDGEKKESQSIVGYYSNLSKALVGIQRDYVLSSGNEIQTIKDYKKRASNNHYDARKQFRFTGGVLDD